MAEPPTPPRCQVCIEGLVKPDIVFFGEGLPQRFFKVSLCALGGEEGLMHLALDYDRLDCSPYSIPLILLFNHLLFCFSLSLSLSLELIAREYFYCAFCFSYLMYVLPSTFRSRLICSLLLALVLISRSASRSSALGHGYFPERSAILRPRHRSHSPLPAAAPQQGPRGHPPRPTIERGQ